MTRTFSSTKAPAEGERRARRGYVHQDRSSARLIYAALLDRTLQWVGLADCKAGSADDLVLGLANCVVAHQFKRATHPTGVGITKLLLGTEAEIERLAAAFMDLQQQFPGTPIEIRYLSNDFPSTNDKLVSGTTKSSTAAFIDEWVDNPKRSLKKWRQTNWAPLIEQLLAASKLNEPNFELFWPSLKLVLGAAASAALEPSSDQQREKQIEELSRALNTFVADHDKDRWTREKLLAQLDWPDRYGLHFTHSFPIGEYVQRNEETEANLNAKIDVHTQGYVSLVGPPGVGKSTLLQRELRDGAGIHVLRYLAFVPGATQGQGRGEADSFYDDITSQFAKLSLRPPRVKEDSTHARREAFEFILAKAGEDFCKRGTRYIIILDGLDHIPREECPDRSLLRALPLPQSVPEGVLFVLGTQRLDLKDIPFSVREEAGAADRRVEVSPLPERAVATMAKAMGLPADISRTDVYAITRGHPLVSRYLIEKLINSGPSERTELLKGQHGFGGELEDVYAAAWRGVEQAENSEQVKRVLSLIAFAEGLIEPALLASATSEEAVEKALSQAGHLLDRKSAGWTVFHNSFRLFLQNKRILKFGELDPQFERSAINRTLADLAVQASSLSPQRWLRFRYLFLAGDLNAALGLAGRSYFAGQYCRGRTAVDVQGDISDAFRALKRRSDPSKLFDLLLASDEVERRANIMEGATSLIDACLEAGDLASAEEALSTEHEDGKQWLVIDGLLKAGETARARQIFDRESPFRAMASNASLTQRPSAAQAQPWAQRAIRFLDEDQIERIIASAPHHVPHPSGFDGEQHGREQLSAAVKLAVALAFAEADPGADADSLIAHWDVAPEDAAMVRIECAEAAFAVGNGERAAALVRTASADPNLDKLHASWRLGAARIALKVGDAELAEIQCKATPLEGLSKFEGQVEATRLVDIAEAMVGGVAFRAQLGLPIAPMGSPQDRLLRGVQHHLIRAATALGNTRAGRPVAAGMLDSIVTSALRFLANARVSESEDWYTNHLLPQVAPVLASVLFALIEAENADPAGVAATVDKLLSEDAIFRHWPSFRRKVVLEAYRLDRNKSAATDRLETALTDLTEHGPREEMRERAEYAAAFAEVGDRERAGEILSELRRDALGVFLPAKKDAQYELWTKILAKANTADPAGRTRRAATALRLLGGLEQTEGYDMAGRIGREFLFEAAVSSPALAWSAGRRQSETGTISWDGISDALLRSVLSRSPHLAKAVLTVWSHLCLPWYGEPHGSTTRDGEFLSDMIAAVPQADMVGTEELAADAIGLFEQRAHKEQLLAVLEEAASARGGGSAARKAAQRWSRSASMEQTIVPDQRSYAHVVRLADVASAIADEQAYHQSQEQGGNKHEIELSFALRRAAARVLAKENWETARDFIANHPELSTDKDVSMALAQVATAAGDKPTAQKLLNASLPTEPDGWSWPTDRGRLRMHQARHILAEVDAFDFAREEFLDDMANARYGVASALWAVDDIFSVLFEKVPWTELWDYLDAGLKGMREYRLGTTVEPDKSIKDDVDLLAALLSWSSTLGVPMVRAQAARAIRKLNADGFTPLVIATTERLLNSDGEARFFAMLALADVAEQPAVVDRFKTSLPVLAADPDAGVAWTAHLLATRWNYPLAAHLRDLPAFYNLELPDREGSAGGLANQETRGLVIDHPLDWTIGWENLAESIARNAGVDATTVRWRVGSLIRDWGGIDRFGHPASKLLQASLEKLSLVVPYRRPQAEGVYRALRHVIEELWRSGRIRSSRLRILLHQLHASAEPSGLPEIELCPLGVSHPDVPDDFWGKKFQAWTAGVENDVALPAAAQEKVLAEWQRLTVRRTRVSAIAERFVGVLRDGARTKTLDDLLFQLPRTVKFGTILPLYRPEDGSAGGIAGFEPNSIDGEPILMIVLCPVLAERLGWRADSDSAHIYRNTDGSEMARTVWWRNGWQQASNEDDWHAEGQRIVLSDQGHEELRRQLEISEPVVLAWRRTESQKDDGPTEARFATSRPATVPIQLERP